MNTMQTPKEPASDEINLNEVFKVILIIFKRIFRSIVNFCKTFSSLLFKRGKIVLLIVTICTALGLSFYLSIKPYFLSKMTLSSNYYKGEILSNAIEGINQLCEEDNYYTLSKVLKIDESEAKNIKEITVKPIISDSYKRLIERYSKEADKQAVVDSLLLYSDQTNFQLHVQVYDLSTLDNLDSVLVKYLKSNNYIKKRAEIDRVNLLNMKDKLLAESSKIDSLKSLVANNIAKMSEKTKDGSNNIYLATEKSTDPLEIVREDISLYQKMLEIDKQLYLDTEIEIIEGFIPYDKPVTGSLLKNVVRGFLGGLIISMIYISILSLKYLVIKQKSNKEEVYA